MPDHLQHGNLRDAVDGGAGTDENQRPAGDDAVSLGDPGYVAAFCKFNGNTETQMKSPAMQQAVPVNKLTWDALYKPTDALPPEVFSVAERGTTQSIEQQTAGQYVWTVRCMLWKSVSSFTKGWMNETTARSW